MLNETLVATKHQFFINLKLYNCSKLRYNFDHALGKYMSKLYTISVDQSIVNIVLKVARLNAVF